ncbi:MAG: OadG family protein, partial [Muribaculaceae bacterium]
AISAMSVVFTGLILLYISFKFAGRAAVGMHDRHKARKIAARGARSQSLSPAHEAEETPARTEEAPSGEVYAAIAMALYELQANVHDVESNVLTIRRPGSSAWNDKAGTLRRMPQKR